MGGEAVERAWREQSAWSQVADRLKRDLELWRAAALLCTLTAAACSAGGITFGLSSGPGKFLAFASAVSVGAAGLAYSQADSQLVQEWLAARSISEALKSEVYLVLAGQGVDDFDARVAELEASARPLWHHRLSGPPGERDLPAVHDVNSYLAVRVGGQVEEYYRPRAAALKRRLRRLRRTEVALTVSGVILAAAAGTWEVDRAALWVPVVTTLTATVAGHSAGRRYEFLLMEYLQTAGELELIRDRRGPYASKTDPELVEMAEHVISIQNEGWMARLSQADETPPTTS